MRHYAKITVSPELAELMERLCECPPLPDHDVQRCSTTFDHEVRFENGNRMAVQVVVPNDPDIESCWTQGVMFDNLGNELACTEPGDTFLGEYSITWWDEEFVVEVATCKDYEGRNSVLREDKLGHST